MDVRGSLCQLFLHDVRARLFPLLLKGCRADHGLIGLGLFWSAIWLEKTRLSYGGRPEMRALCSEQINHRVVRHEQFVDDCSAEGLVGHSLGVAVRPSLRLRSEQLHAGCATSHLL